MSKLTKILIPLAVFLVLVVPSLSFSASLVPCNNNTVSITNSYGTVTPAVPCDFNALMKLVNGGINFILKFLAIPIAAIMFFYAGFLMVTSGGSSESKTKAKNIFTNTAIGIIFIAGSWLIIKMILTILGYNSAWIFN